jgi:hypothetical protein
VLQPLFELYEERNAADIGIGLNKFEEANAELDSIRRRSVEGELRLGTNTLPDN